MNNKDYQKLREKTMKQFKNGEPLFGKEGALAPLLKSFIEDTLKAEMEAYLDEEVRRNGNKLNGKKNKTIKSSDGTFIIDTPQDRKSNFEPRLIPKHETILADNLQKQIIALYAIGSSYRDIAAHIKEMYDTDISPSVLSRITDRIIPEVQAWQKRPLDEVYPVVWLDAMFFKVKDQGVVKQKCLYNILALTTEGRKEILGMYLAETEGAKLWLKILTDLQNRGVKDILIACIDNLKGFYEAIQTIFPKTEVQICIVHQLRNSLRYIASKDYKEFLRDLKEIYKAPSKTAAEEALVALSQKWGHKYPIVVKSWENNWEKLSAYFDYPAEIRKMIYTTNAVEGLHRQIRKVTKTKGSFDSDMALLKLVYLSMRRIAVKWERPIQNWGLTAQQFSIKFGERMPLKLTLNQNQTEN